jgi:hypothetical protein
MYAYIEEYDAPDMKTENGIMAKGNIKSAWFKDTEGNIMALVERLAGIEPSSRSPLATLGCRGYAATSM